MAVPAPQPVYPVLFIDTIHVTIRDGKVANRPVYTALAVSTEGERDILGLWAGDGGVGASSGPACSRSRSAKVLFSTNAVESLNARFRRAVRARGHFPSDRAALKYLYLTLRSLDPSGQGRQRWAIRWKPALNAFAAMFEGRIIPNQ